MTYHPARELADDLHYDITTLIEPDISRPEVAAAVTTYDYDDVENTQPPIELARKRLTDYITEWGDGVVDSFQYDFRTGASHDLHTRDIGALLTEADRLGAVVSRIRSAIDEIDSGSENVGPSENLRLYLAVSQAVKA